VVRLGEEAPIAVEVPENVFAIACGLDVPLLIGPSCHAIPSTNTILVAPATLGKQATARMRICDGVSAITCIINDPDLIFKGCLTIVCTNAVLMGLSPLGIEAPIRMSIPDDTWLRERFHCQALRRHRTCAAPAPRTTAMLIALDVIGVLRALANIIAQVEASQTHGSVPLWACGERGP